MDYKAKTGLSRNQIRRLSKIIRKGLGIDTLRFPVLKVLDKLETLYPDNLYYVVENGKFFEKGVPAYLEQETTNTFCIHIKQSVYTRALHGNGGCLGFIAHEIAHFLLIFVFGIGADFCRLGDTLIFARETRKQEIKIWDSMEWQAKALCGELMIPFEKCKDMSLEEIIYYTNSSMEQAKYFVNKVVPHSK